MAWVASVVMGAPGEKQGATVCARTTNALWKKEQCKGRRKEKQEK